MGLGGGDVIVPHILFASDNIRYPGVRPHFEGEPRWAEKVKRDEDPRPADRSELLACDKAVSKNSACVYFPKYQLYTSAVKVKAVSSYLRADFLEKQGLSFTDEVGRRATCLCMAGETPPQF